MIFNTFLVQGICQHGTCMNTLGSFRCDCEPGYVFDSDSHQCVDRNECTTPGLNPCSGLAQGQIQNRRKCTSILKPLEWVQLLQYFNILY